MLRCSWVVARLRGCERLTNDGRRVVDAHVRASSTDCCCHRDLPTIPAIWIRTSTSSNCHCVMYMRIQARRSKTLSLFGHLFFNITHVFCAKKRVGHACICPMMDIGWPVLKSYPPPKLGFPPKMAFYMDAHPLLKKNLRYKLAAPRSYHYLASTFFLI